MKHPWGKYEERFCVVREWDDYPAMHKTIVAECKKAGVKPPTITQIRQTAGRKQWTKKRTAVDRVERAKLVDRMTTNRVKEKEKIEQMHRNMFGLGEGLVAMGANYIKAAEEAKAINKVGAVTSFYEAATAIRVGATLARLAAQALTPQAKEIKADDEDQGEGIETGIIIVPQQETAEKWEKGRRKNLAKPKDEEPADG